MKIIINRNSFLFFIIVVFSLAFSSNSMADINQTTQIEMTLLAGNTGGKGNLDGFAKQARFTFPSDIAIDRQGNFYIADGGDDVSSPQSNNTIRKISKDGQVTTLAGLAGAFGSSNGQGSIARFNYPKGVAVDLAGNVYVADTGNHIIRKITPKGLVSTYAGSAGESGSVDGKAELARFNFPKDVAVDHAGNVYVADTNNNTIRKITTFGKVSTFAGKTDEYDIIDGEGSLARFKNPVKLVIDLSNNLYVADGNFIRKITSNGVVSTILASKNIDNNTDGSFENNSENPAEKNTENKANNVVEKIRFDGLSGIAVDKKGNIFVTDSGTAVRKITPTGEVTTFAGSLLGYYHSIGSNDGVGTDAKFSQPKGMAIDNAGTLYLADSGNHTIRQITPSSKVSTLAGQAVTGTWIDAVADEARFNDPKNITVDDKGNVFVAVDFGALRKISPSGIVSTLDDGNWDHLNLAGAVAKRYRSFNQIKGMATDSEGDLYVSNVMQSKSSGGGSYSPLPAFLKKKKFDSIIKITPSGRVKTLVGKSAKLNFPSGIIVGQDRSLFVAASYDQTILKINPRTLFSAKVTVFAGEKGQKGSRNGVGSRAQFNRPTGIAMDSHGNLFVADYYNNTIRKITPSGLVTTFAGKSGQAGSENGLGKAASFDGPLSITCDGNNNLYVVDYNNYTVRKISPEGMVSTFAGKVGKIGFIAGRLPGALPVPHAVAVNGDTLYISVRNAVVQIKGIL